MEPKTRREHFLAKIAGNPYDSTILPKTREEFFLNDIAESGGGGSSLVETIEDVLLPETTMTFNKPLESGTPFVFAKTTIPTPSGSLPQGCRVVVDGERVGEAGLVSNNNTIVPSATAWEVEINVPTAELGEAVEQQDNPPSEAFLTVSYYGEDQDQYLGEHTVSVVIYTVKASQLLRFAVQDALSGNSSPGDTLTH